MRVVEHEPWWKVDLVAEVMNVRYQDLLRSEVMPESAVVAKSTASQKALKQSLNKVTKKLPKKRRKTLKQRYLIYVYQVYPSTRILSETMNVMNSFTIIIFAHIASEASHLIHYRCQTISARAIQSAICLMLLGNWPNTLTLKARKRLPNKLA
eukprot:g34654.t1